MNSPVPSAFLRLLATSDVHMHISGWDALRDTPKPGYGMEGLATVIADARRAARGACMLFDNGDALQGTPIGDTCAAPDTASVHPWPRIVNALGYDAIGLGNHDFDFGVPFLSAVTQSVRASVLCANVTPERMPGVRPSVILQRDIGCTDDVTRSLAIGITSVLPPQTAIWNHRHLDGRLSFDDGVPAAEKAVQYLKTGGADIIVLLCHSGLPPNGETDAENFASEIARKVPGIDAMIMGHTHQMFPNEEGPVARGVDPRQGTLHGVPTVMPGYAAEALGVIDLDLAWSQHGWQVKRHASGLRHHPPTIAPDPELAELTAPAIAATRAALDVEVGRTPTGFHNYFEMLGTGPSTALIGAAMCAVITKRAAGTPLSDLPVIASVSPMALGGRGGTSNYVDVPQGVITERHLSMMCPYPNAVWAAVLTGAQVRAWAERAAVFFSPIPTGLSALVNPNAPSFNFDALYGLNTVVDPFAPVAYAVDGRPIAETATRIIAQSYQGKPIDASDRFLVAMTSYRGAGGGAFPGVGCETIRTEVEVKDALRQLIRNGGPNEASPEPAWHFSTGHKAPVLIETSPRATQHLDEIAKFNPIVAGKNSAGFLQLEVSI